MIEYNEFNKALEIEIRREEEDFKDLMNDFNFVKELNRELADKYSDLLSSFPKSQEIEIILSAMKDNVFNLELKVQMQRVFQLQRFKSACVALEKQDPIIKPPRYEELEK